MPIELNLDHKCTQFKIRTGPYNRVEVHCTLTGPSLRQVAEQNVDISPSLSSKLLAREFEPRGRQSRDLRSSVKGKLVAFGRHVLHYKSGFPTKNVLVKVVGWVFGTTTT